MLITMVHRTGVQFVLVRAQQHLFSTLKIEPCDQSSFGNYLNALCDRNQDFHCVRGQGILDPFLGVEFKKQKKCFVRVVRQLFVAGDQKKITR